MRLPHVIDYRMYLDEGDNLCLKGRAGYLLYALAIMMFLWTVLPVAAYNDKSTNFSGTAFFLLFALFVLGLSTSVRLVFFKPIQRSITFARSGTITIRDRMIIGHSSFDLRMDDMVAIAFTYSARSGLVKNYRVLVRLRDGTDRFLVDENVVLFERAAGRAMDALSSLLKELRRDTAISVIECRADLYQTHFDRGLQDRRPKRPPRPRHPHES